MQQEKLLVGDIEINIKRHKMTRYPKIKVFLSGEVRLVVPPRYSRQNCESFLQSHALWIATALEKIAKKMERVENSSLGYDGKILFFGELFEPQQIADKNLKLHLKNSLLIYLSERCSVFGGIMGVRYTKITIRKTKNRFGSCNHRNELSFSSQLVFVPTFVIDYVIIHELAHIVHKNHSAQFWALVDEHCAKRREAKKWIRENFEILSFMNERYL